MGCLPSLLKGQSLPGRALPGRTRQAGGTASGKAWRDETVQRVGGTRRGYLVMEWGRGGEDAGE